MLDPITHASETSIVVQVKADLVDPGTDAPDGKLTKNEYQGKDFSDLFKPLLPGVGGPFYASADVNLNLLLEAGINDSLPSLQAKMDLNWHIDIGYDPVNGIVADNKRLYFVFNDIGINLGDFLGRQVMPVLEQIIKYIEPLQPVIDLLQKEVPGVTQLSKARGNGPVTFLDLAMIKNPDQAKQAKKFIAALDKILKLYHEFKSHLEPDGKVFILKDRFVISDPDAPEPTVDPDDPKANEDVKVEAVETDTEGTPEKPQGTVKQILQSLEDLGFEFQILDVKSIVSFLLHRPFNVLSYNIPRFELDFSWEKSIPVWSPPEIDVRIGLDFSVFADLSVGYDSHGLVTGRFFDGFYFGDRADVFRGADIDEMGLSLGVRLAAILNLAVARRGNRGRDQGRRPRELARYRQRRQDASRRNGPHRQAGWLPLSLRFGRRCARDRAARLGGFRQRGQLRFHR